MVPVWVTGAAPDVQGKDGKKPVSHQLVKGLQKAFTRFDEYQLAKYNRAKTVKLRDVLRVARPTPANDEQSALWKCVVAGELLTPDTWEVAISACGDNNLKKASEYRRLIEENKLGDLAFLRNLRKMREVGVGEDVIRKAFNDRKWKWIIPYQFISASVYNPSLEDALEDAMFKCLAEVELVVGKTAVLIDVSGSMDWNISGKSKVLRVDVAIGLAVLLREVCKDVHIFSFNTEVKQMPPRRSFALRDVIREELGGGTNMWQAVRKAGQTRRNNLMIVITDEQTSDTGRYIDANAELLVIVNVASYKNGVGYEKGVLHISGWSDNVIIYIRNYLKREYDKLNN